MTLIEKNRTITASTKRHEYSARLAQTLDEVRRAQRLRFEVFNLELNEGLAESHFNGLDADPFDTVCDHLIVEHTATSDIVGTYRLQTGQTAAANIGYYSQREFDFAPYESIRSEIIELGRACVHANHRNFGVLHLLWRGIALYAREQRARFLVGCSSLTSQNPNEGEATYQRLQSHLVTPALRTQPWPEFALGLKAAEYRRTPKRKREMEAGNGGHVLESGGAPPLSDRPGSTVSSTAGASAKLLRAYLAIGAKVCGPPALDREFGTIDFLTLLDLQALPAVVRAHFFG